MTLSKNIFWFFFSLGIIPLGETFAQSLYNNGSLINIKPNTTLSVSQDAINNGEITNNGTLLVSGTWLNNGTYNAGSGELKLNGDQPQVVNHNDQSFTTLTISGGGEKLFEADIIINNELVLEEGALRSVGGARIVIVDGAFITGGSEDSFIEGPLYHRGTGPKYYPIGENGNFLPAELLDVQGANPEIGVFVFEPNSNDLIESNVEEVSPNRYWQIEVAGGTYSGSKVSLAVLDETFINDFQNVVVAFADGTNFPFSSLGKSSASGDQFLGSVTSQETAPEGVLSVAVLASSFPEDSDLKVYNAVSPNGDGLHDFLEIENIESFPGNVVSIYNRWGSIVFEITDYNNQDRVFDGEGNTHRGGMLNDGTYFYKVDKNNGSQVVQGFFVLRK